MAKLYGEILSSALMTFDKSFARANGQPLDSTEVYYSLAAAQEYAAGAGAYVGQKIVVVENGIVTHYGIENEAGALKELGSKPVGDNSSIVVAEDGTISLKGVGALVFERELEDGTKEAIQYQPLMTSAGLVWVEPSKTTVEGLATLIDGLSVRVKALEDDHIGADDIKDFVTNDGLAEAIKDFATDAEVDATVKVEADRALAAEKALGERIDAIDFVDDTELTDAIAAARELISAEIDADVKVAKDRADEAYTLADSKVDSTTYATDKETLETAIAAAKKAGDDAQATIDAFLTSEEVDETVNTLKEIQAELSELGEAVDLEEQFAAKADKTVVEGIEGRVKAIEDAPYVTKSQLDGIDSKFDSYTNTTALTELLAGKQDVIPADTYDVFGAAATAKSEAIEEAANAAAALYATQTALGNLETALDGRLDVLEAINHELYATKAELEAHEKAAVAAYATKDELAPVAQTANNAAAKVETLEDKIEEITSVGGEPNVIDYVKVNGTILEVEKDAEGKSTKTVNVIVPTKFTDITDDSGFGQRLTKVESDVVTAQTAADNAGIAAAQAQGEVDALETVVGNIQTTVSGHAESINAHSSKLTALENADSAHTAEYIALKAIVDGHTTDIAGKAASTDLAAAVSRIATNETAIQVLNETTIPAINEEIGKKANASALSDYYKKTEIDAITGEVAEGKTIVKMIEEAQSTATYDDAEVRGLISDNADAIKAIYNKEGDADATGVLVTEITRVEGLISAEADRADKAEKALGERIDDIDALLNTVDSEDNITSLKELATWVTEHGGEAAEMAKGIQANADAIADIYSVDDEGTATGMLVTEIARVEKKADDNSALITAINDSETGILAVAKKYTDDSIAGLPAATAEALGLVKYDDTTIKMNDSQQLYVAQVSTDVLVQGSNTLILNGGSATE